MRSVAAPEDDDTQRHGYSPSYAQRHGGVPYYHPYEWRGQETVINGTAQYHQNPRERHGQRAFQSHGDSDFSVTHQAMAPRYGDINPDNSLGLEGFRRPEQARRPGSRHHRKPHAVAHGVMPYSPYARGPVRAHPVAPFYDGPHDAMPYDKGPHGIMGPGGAHGAMPFYPYDGSARAHDAVRNPARAHDAVRNPARAEACHEACVPANSFPASLGAPPHAIQMLGKTTRKAVTWCDMTMSVTVTSQAAAVIEWIQRQSGDLFGFDLEWKPNFLKGKDNKVALLQLCGPNDCLIFQFLYADMIPNTLVEFLLNPKKWLGGVGIRQDVNKLEKDHGLACQGHVELGTLASEKLQRNDLQGGGLKKLVDQVLGMALAKSKKITMSNWEREYLDEKQIQYACIDAWAAFAILQKLMAQETGNSCTV